MRVAVFGAGAIGGFLAVRLVQSGVDVTVVARGPHLAAMQANGLRLISGEEDVTVHPRCVSDANAAGMQDYVFVTLKAHSLPAAAPQIAAMMGPDSALVTGINGVPYWYFHGLEGPWEAAPWRASIPAERCWRCCRRGQAIGCVVYPAAEVRRARRDRAHLRRPFHARRAGRQSARHASSVCPRR